MAIIEEAGRLSEIRSIAVGNLAGAEPATLQLDITRNKPVDDNAFHVELATIVENSFNIHQEGTKLLFREEENPRAKLIAYARNDKLFADGADQAQLAKQVRYVIAGSDEVAKTFRVITLPRTWANDPWTLLDDAEHPDRWDDRLPILVLPEEPDKLDATLGRWLKDQLQKRRNTVRFLLPRAGSTNAFLDRDLLSCRDCGANFHVEEDAARMAPDAPLYVAPSETPYSVLDPKKRVVCPHCGHAEMIKLGKPR